MYKDICSCRICREAPRFVIEWYFINDKGNLQIAVERGICGNFEHMIDIVSGENNLYGNFPDGVVDFETLDFQYADILSVLEKAVSIRLNPEMFEIFCKKGQKVIDEIPGFKKF